ncbi:YidC/Oxa1 family membrane protein insertase [Paenibacillus athensensis]|uniref:Membrane insertase YidC/Oxa/ALB C-terminal domain-containing protein n=1 Tax=Paenibacillus athensensis TaxID=1967502 RepID=A0A4Y8PQX7_9BACL|nr:YidC/Oxa1 family membrane protein insertase [Paenibacillus athensensis]MCD1259277.1 YidC/Oxa1 family membrane protein insertase [Paenibacillus athensensis]
MSSILQPVTDVLHAALVGLYHLSLDWGVALIVLTMALRSVLFIFNLRTARQQMRQLSMRPELERLRTAHQGDHAALLQETAKLYGKYGVKPMSMLTTALIQAPLFLGMYRLFAQSGSAMTSHLIPWVATLGQFDPLHIIPVAYALITLASMLMPLVPDMAVAGSTLQRLGLPLVMWSAPVAVGMYSATNALFAIAERGFYRTPLGRKWLLQGMPAASAG